MASKKKNNPKTPPAKTPASKSSSKSASPRGLHLNLSTKVKEEIAGLLVMAFSVLLILALVSHRPEEQPATIIEMWRADKLGNFLGIVGAYLSHVMASYTFGYAALAFPILLVVYGWLIFTHRRIFIVNQFAFYILTLMMVVSVWLAIPSTLGQNPQWGASGLIGGIIAQTLFQYLGGLGTATVWAILTLVWFIMVTRISIADLIPAVHTIFVQGWRQATEIVGHLRAPQGDTNQTDSASTPLVPQYLQGDSISKPIAEPAAESADRQQQEKLTEVPPHVELAKEKPGDAALEETRKAEPVQPDTNQTSGISFDTALVKDMKSIGRIDKQFVVPDIRLPDTDGLSPQAGTDEIDVPAVLQSDTGDVAQHTIDLEGVDFKDVAKSLFEQEHGTISLDQEPVSASGKGIDSKSVVEPAKDSAVDDSVVFVSKDTAVPEGGGHDGKSGLAEALSLSEIPEGKPLAKPASKETDPELVQAAARKSRNIDKENQAARNKYRVPSLELLDPTQEQERLTDEDIRQLDDKISQIISTLAQFGINTKVVGTEYGGPVVAIYQLELPSGLKISRITGLEDELALSMKVKSVRMVPVTAKGTIQVEIPKPRASAVLIRSIFEDKTFKSSRQKYRLGLALGKTIDGHIHIEDLAKMPHLLLAGTTGSGKSVGVNSMITSLLYQFDPSDVKFVMIDPKKVELALYRNLKNHHLICLCNQDGEIIEDVITKPENAKLMLKALVEEMEERYEKLAHANVRNIEDYNKRWAEGRMPDDGEHEHFKLEYIIAIIDELADLMMTAPREIETSITRLAQMARAVGIHLIVATQRPSVDVLTGLIKANFPARIAYQVRSKIDSRTILDMGGAELLLGKGDMLYLPPGQMPIRIQNAFTSTRETEEIVDFISRMPAFPRKYFTVKEEPREDVDGEMEAGAYDALFNDALDIVVKHNQGSASLLQRRLSIGYARAARIIDQLERAGVVGAQDGGKPRQVLITEDQVAMYRV